MSTGPMKRGSAAVTAFLNRLKKDSQLRDVLLLSVLVGLGLLLRIRNLGELSLIADEGVQALAVEAILEHGLPEMDSGLVYLRGPLYLYAQGALAFLFGLNEFWLRLPSVLFGVAAIVPAYVFGKDLFSRPVGILSAVIITLSIWEIEMSRYARVYIALQFFFLVALICFYRGFMRDEHRFKIWFLVASFFAFLTHELSQVLVVLFVIPLFSAALTRARKLALGGWALGLGTLLFVQRKITGLHVPEGSSSTSPHDEGTGVDVLDQIASALGLPALNMPDMGPFLHVVQQSPTAVGTIGAIAGLTTAYLLYRLFRGEKGGKVALGGLMLGAAIGYQFGLVLIFLVVYLALFARGRHSFRDRTLIATLGGALFCIVGWFALLVTSLDLPLTQVPLVLFGFPAFYKYLLRWLIEGWPLMTVLLTVGSLYLFARFLRTPRDPAALFLLGSLYVPAFFYGLFRSYFVPRYTLHLYPLIVLIFVVAMWQAGRWGWKRLGLRDVLSGRIAFLCGIPILLLVSQDANPLSAWQIGDRTYQTEKPPVRNVVNYWPYADFHQDVKGASRFVRQRMSSEDKIAVLGPDYVAQLVQYYIGRVDYVLVSEDRMLSIMKDGDRVHYTIGCDFITDKSEFEEMVRKHGENLWVIGDRRTLLESNPYFSDVNVEEKMKELSERPEYLARDEITFVIKGPMDRN